MPNLPTDGYEQQFDYTGPTGRPRVVVNTLPVMEPVVDDGGMFSQGTKFGNRLFGTGGEERYQTWPEKMVREAISAPGDIMQQGSLPPGLRREDFTDRPAPDGMTVAASPYDDTIGKAQAVSALAGTGILAAEKGALGSAGGALIQPELKAPTFYSAVERQVLDSPQSKMAGDQWLSTLGNKPGVKPDELQWTGLDKFLEGKKSVTKEEIQAHLDSNKVELGEVVKTGKGKEEYIEGDELDPDFAHTAKTGVKYQQYQVPGGPLSRDTDILTNKGWKRIDAIEIGDVVMTRKDDAGILEWQPVEATPKVYAENLYHFLSQSIDMRVTENHQMIAKKRRRNHAGLVRLTAKELWGKSEMLVPLTGVWNGKGEEKIFGFDANDLAELFGWYLAEGSYKHNNYGIKNTIHISQCKEYNPEKCARIEALLDRMGLPWRYYGDAYGIGVKTIDKDLVGLFHEQPTSESKFVPYFFFNQSASVIQSLLDGLILGDGCTAHSEGRLDKTTFFTNSQQLADDAQVLILLIGKCATIRQRPNGLYCVGIKHKEWSSVDDSKFEIAPYNDFAFCVTVENHAIYVRRNGVAAFTGNSNYREMLMTLPSKDGFNPKNVRIERSQQSTTQGSAKIFYGDKEVGRFDDPPMYNAASKKYEQRSDDYWHGVVQRRFDGDKSLGIKSLSANYKSSHWDEPNILAHMRMNDRTIDGKKSLHLEEIQSDWHQDGRKKGYKGQKPEPTDQEVKDFFQLRDGANPADYRQEMMEHRSFDKGVPDAPFKKNWHELALKRAIREAAENGYDRLSWTAGEHHPTNPKNLNQHGEAAEAADKGMQGFYNNILPKSVEKLTGQKVQKGSINVGKQLKDKSAFYEYARENGFPRASEAQLDRMWISEHELAKDFMKIPASKKIHYIDIPQSLRERIVGKGQPLFSSPPVLVPVDHDPFAEKNKFKLTPVSHNPFESTP